MVNEFEMDPVSGGGGGVVTLPEFYTRLGLSSPTADQATAASNAIRAAEAAIAGVLGYRPWLHLETQILEMGQYGQAAASVDDVGVWDVSGGRAYLDRGGRPHPIQLKALPVRQCRSDGSDLIKIYLDYAAMAGAGDSDFESATLLTHGSDFAPRYDTVDSSGYGVSHNGLVDYIGTWPSDVGTVKAVYLAGYTPEELRGTNSQLNAADITEAVLLESTARIHTEMGMRYSAKTGWGGGRLMTERLGDYSYTRDSRVAEMVTVGKFRISVAAYTCLESRVNMGSMLG